MSPPALRRYRAERLLRQEFEGLRGRVIAMAGGRLRASGVTLDPGDLEGCYAQAWQGLYMAMLEGQEIASPTGWLTLVTFRRAIEEYRARRRTQWGSRDGAGESEPHAPAGPESEDRGRDLAAQLDDRVRLRQLFEGLRGRLSKRELQAATLCYLQGFSRSEAAARMGLSEKRMSKLMEGRGPGRPGVANKVGTLAQTIRRGDWCEEQASLMRGFAYGILDPEGERYQLAVSHQSQCSACRAYVLSLRGLAAVLPLPPLPLSITAAVAASAGARAAGAGARAAGGGARAAGGGARAAGGGAKAAGAGTEAAAPGLAGAGGAGGGWLVAGGAGAKFAVGCVLAVGIGAGCVALNVNPVTPRRARHTRPASRSIRPGSISQRVGPPALSADRSPATSSPIRPSPTSSARLGPRAGEATRAPSSAPTSRASAASAKASREFGIEQGAGGASTPVERGPAEPRAAESPAPESHKANTAAAAPHSTSSAGGEEAAAAAVPSSTSAGRSSGGAAAAEREFGPG
jgi:DNA-directed RNA polymerase specialized sigma24 family protein